MSDRLYNSVTVRSDKTWKNMLLFLNIRFDKPNIAYWILCKSQDISEGLQIYIPHQKQC